MSSKRPSRRIAQDEAAPVTSSAKPASSSSCESCSSPRRSSTVASNSVTTANGVRSSASIRVTCPSTSARKNSPSIAIISPSRWLSVPSPRSPCSASSRKLRSPSKAPSSSAPIVEAWKSTCGSRSSCRSARRIDSTCSDRIQRSSSIGGSLSATPARERHRRKGAVVKPSEAMAAIELRDVVKTFGPITAVDGLDLEVPQGICLGLLGPNGAGKSTTMRLLTGQAIADSGRLRVLGYELPGEAKTARGQMGVVPQLDNLDVDVTVEDNLAIFARLYRVRDVPAAVDRGLALARLTE